MGFQKSRLNSALIIVAALGINLGFFMSLSILGAIRSKKNPEFGLIDIPVAKLQEPKKRRKTPPEKIKPQSKPKPAKRERIRKKLVTMRNRRSAPKPRQLKSMKSMSQSFPMTGMKLDLDGVGDFGVAAGDEVVFENSKSQRTGNRKGYDLGEVDSPPRKLACPSPSYPRMAREREMEGWVRLKLLVNEEGKVKSVEVLQSEPKGVFDEAAGNAVKQWDFIPAMAAGRPVPTWCVITITFKLDF